MHVLPAARTEALLVEHVGAETVVYDLSTKEVHCLSPLAAAVFGACGGSRGSEGGAAVAQDRLGKPVPADDVAAAVAQLGECDLLDTPLRVHDGLSRREAVRKVALAGATAAFAAPLVTSIVAPNEAAADSKLPPGCSCTKNPDCQSNHCCKEAGNNDKCNDGCCASDDNGTDCQCVGTTFPTVCHSIPNPGTSCGSVGPCTPNNTGKCLTA